jgi:site-specific DNA-methyltransferase (adenine-specific)
MWSVNKLIVGNCYEVLHTIADGSIDLILTSPPYAEARSKAYESIVRVEELGIQFERILKPGGILCWNIGDPVEGGIKTTVSYQCVVRWTVDIPKPLYLHDHYALLKDPMPGNSSQRARPGWEHMYVYKKGKDKIIFNVDHFRVRYTNAAKKAVTSRIRQQDGDLVSFTRDQSADLRGKDPGNYLYYPLGSGHTTTDRDAYEHPALMAEAIAEDFILAFTQRGMTVLDPFNGAGTTTKMAYKHKRSYIGIELEQKFTDIAQSRIGNTQQVEFEPKPIYTKEEMEGDSAEHHALSYTEESK